MTKEQFRKSIGENIRIERLQRNMSIDELAELLDLTPGFVGLIERGRRGATAYNIHRISEIFNLSVDKLYAPSSISLKVKISEDATLTAKRRRLMSLAYDLTDKEQEFLINTVKWLRQLRGAVGQDEQG
jgi:transcriptional regulator with XRE-family HTH domain